MSVPRRLGVHSDHLEAGGGSTLSIQPRHPPSFPSDSSEDSSSSSLLIAASSPNAHERRSPPSPSRTLAPTAHHPLHIGGGSFSPAPRAMPSPYGLSTASTFSSPSSSSSNASHHSSLSSPGLHSNYSSPHPYASSTSTSSTTSTTVVSTYSASSSVTSSPVGSPLVGLRSGAGKMSTPPVRFPSPFKSFKSGPPSSPQVVNEAISSIMQDEAGSNASQNANKSPGSPSTRPLYSPKPSPGVRPNVQSPAPSASAPAAVSYNQLPAIDRVHRYVVTGTLQQSLFGVVKLAFDRVLKQQVAIKISRRERAQQQTTRSGVSVLENVRREAAVMQYLHERSAAGHLNRAPVEKRKSLYAEMFANMTVNELLNNKGGAGGGGGSAGAGAAGGGGAKKAKRMSSRATMHMRVSDERMVDDDSSQSLNGHSASVQPASETDTEDSEMRPYTPSSRITVSVSTPSSVSQSHSSYSNLSSPTSFQLPTGPMDATDLEGERYICRYVEELEDDSFHYLVTDFIPAGDLYSMLTSFPQHRLSEVQAKGLFRQMVLGVKYLHLRNVAHLDMSLENMCLDMEDAVRIIDFGVAALHPFTPTSFQTTYFSFPSASSPISFPSSSNQSNLPSPPASGVHSSSNEPCVPAPHRSFLCKPVKELYAKPGKIRYMSPELFQGLAWDAFANDVFSLGVILYSLLTGRPPFQQAESSDVWFHVIYSGQWLSPQIRKQPSAHVYTHLSDQALSLINFILKPQEVRPTCEQILQHPWMQME